MTMQNSTVSLDLKSAILCLPLAGWTRQEERAAQMLVQEIEKRTNLRWEIRHSMPDADRPAVVLGRSSEWAALWSNNHEEDPRLARWVHEAKGSPAEGYQIHTVVKNGLPQVYVLGNDIRGVLFGAGCLLRHLEMTPGQVTLPHPLELVTAPKYALRGHQLGYRDKTNSYDAWDLPQWDQYIRELAIFGTNAIELIPPRSDDRPDSVHFPLPPMEMMEGMSRVADDYGLDVWIWYPALDDDYSRPEMVEFALNEWGEVYRRLPRIDAILVPGGDPGNTRPRYLLPMIEKQAVLLHKYYPRAQMWISAQGFNNEWMDEFLGILSEESPDWLTGVVWGPWIHMKIAEFRALVPARYPIRSYPDITHSVDCQYPVPQWDIAYALTEGRETINPRPVSESAIFRQMGEDVIGFLTYSEGCNDDVNKFIWSSLGWDPSADVFEILCEYSRFFIGPAYAQAFAQGLMALEQNWVGPLAANSTVTPTLQAFQAMERSASPRLLQNWRFQQALYRAYYDAYTRARLLFETGLEEQALDYLRRAKSLGAHSAMSQAAHILDKAVNHEAFVDWRTRIFQLAEALFQSIHMQLSVPLYYAQSETRGANLDGLDYPLNDRPWLLDQMARIRALPDEGERLAEIERLVYWTDPGPGGYYVDLSSAWDCPWIVPGLPYEEDPGFYYTPHRRFPYWKDPRPIRRAWRAYTGALNDVPFRMVFPNLDPTARYRLRVVFSDTEEDVKIRLVANDGVEVHPFILKVSPRGPMEFDLPYEATCGGSVSLAWYREPGLGGLGAGQEISEIWVMKKNSQ